MSLSSQGGPRPDRWIEPRQPLDPCMRRQTYGRVLPMDAPRPVSVWSRLFRWA